MRKWMLGVCGVAIWLVAAPMVFVILYSVIEIQAAARASATGDARLADLQVVNLARDLNDNRRETIEIRKRIAFEQDQMGRLAPVLNGNKIEIDRNRGLVRAQTLELAAQYGLPITQAQCTAPTEVLGKCAHQRDDTACAADWQLATDCYYRLIASGVRPELKADAPFNERLDQVEASMAAARNAGYAYNAQVKQFKIYVDHIPDEKKRLEDLDPAKLSAGKDGQFLGVAQAYLIVAQVPLLTQLFLLPPGVSVALFTALMGALGALVGNLSTRFSPATPASPSGVQIIFVKPVLGALAGFMVFFVVAAGAAFLVQPGGKGATDAVNSLSAPALASLGIFAGLAADTAIEWLKARATAFFKVD